MFKERSSVITLLLIGVAVLVGGMITYTLYTEKAREQSKDSLEYLEDEQVAVFPDLEGNAFDITQFKGKVLIINSWATWSPLSKDELVMLAELKRSIGEDVEIIAINRMEPKDRAQSYIESLGVTDAIHVLFDPGDQYFTYVDGYAMPETILYNPDGVIDTHVRGVVNEAALRERIEVLRGDIRRGLF